VYWPCESTSVCLGSTPRAPTRVGGLRAVSPRFWLQGQWNDATPLPDLAALQEELSTRPTLARGGTSCPGAALASTRAPHGRGAAERCVGGRYLADVDWWRDGIRGARVSDRGRCVDLAIGLGGRDGGGACRSRRRGRPGRS